MSETKPRLELVRGLGGWAVRRHRRRNHDRHGNFPEAGRDGVARRIHWQSFIVAWIVGAVLSLFGALAYAELGAAIPEAGGEYAYLRRAFGPVWGFLFGWTHSIVARPASVASIAAGVLRFWGFMMPSVAAPIHMFDWNYNLFGAAHHFNFVFSWAQPLAILVMAADHGN